MTKMHRLPDRAGFRHFAGEPLTVYCLGKLNGFSQSAAALVLGERVAMGDCFMAVSGIALAAFAAAQAAAPSPGTKWVPLQSAQSVPLPSAPVAPAPAPEVAAPENPATAPAAVAQTGVQQPLFLTCTGGGTADKLRGGFIGGRWGWASVISHHDRQFDDQVDVRLFTGDDRIRLPRTMLPGIHGGNAGCFKLKDVVADARMIRAHASVSAFHNPQVYIDRTTGTISISGKDGDYSGECQVIDASAAPKF